jgi:hypothetical protein
MVRVPGMSANRDRLLRHAETYHYMDRLPEEDEPEQPVEAAAGQ